MVQEVVLPFFPSERKRKPFLSTLCLEKKKGSPDVEFDSADAQLLSLLPDTSIVELSRGICQTGSISVELLKGSPNHIVSSF